ncbi:2,4-dichlorophenol 6-monooxygenase [Rhodococcus sp. NKCM2511]|uniref:FAD-dependent monooxygenase n=1 Tax=Rhodococcus sp. NKCM2511 TaxID=2766011 RepID=UPI001910D57D|nr:FAD-dependent monooxygenase [Rhodococcus sp. NKCM2511]GHP19104.1 2,4-dichlorophenol 6-monooxygenase [Rhodococcus sp. NKCM2511]
MQTSDLPAPGFLPFPDDGSGYDTDVVIVGLGPAGGTAALALATYGIRVHAVSIFPWVANSPRAHITNQRAAEVLRDLGVEEEARRYATPWDQMGDTLFTTSLAGREIVRLQTWGTGDLRYGDYLNGSPCTMLDIPQPLMEPVMVKNAAERGAIISFHTEYIDHVQDEHGVTVRLRDVRSGHVFEQRARYLLGFDGARSKIAEELELPFQGELARAGTAYILFKADLSKYVAHRPSILHWIMNSKAGFGEIGMGLLRAIKTWNQWIAGWGFDMADGQPDVSDETVIEQIRTLVGDPELDIEIESRSFWYVNQQYAEHYQSGRVICGGDAVHRHPPSSGLGSNTSVQDAFNIAWKLAFVIKGYAGTDLVETYSPERVPVGKQIVARANQSRKDYAGLREWFDNDSADPVLDGLAKLEDPSPEGVARRERLYEALEHKNTEFNAHGVELNQRYESTAVVLDPNLADEQWPRDRELFLQATTRPGAKLPHAWLVGDDGRRISTLDVVGKGMMTLLTGIGGQAWKHAAVSLDLPYLRTVVVGEPGTLDPYGYWHRLREVHEAGAILVRPDGYVAWRHTEPLWDDAEALASLQGALSSILSSPVNST